MSRVSQYHWLPHCPSLTSQSFPHWTLLIDWSIGKYKCQNKQTDLGPSLLCCRMDTHPTPLVIFPSSQPWVSWEPYCWPPFPINWNIFGPEVEEALVELNMGDLAALRDAIQNAVVGTRWDTSYPIPQFHGKKEEKHEEHSLKVEDWFAHFEIADGDEVARSKETLFGLPRTWIDTVHPGPGSWDTVGDKPDWNLILWLDGQWKEGHKMPCVLWHIYQSCPSIVGSPTD